MIPLTEKPPHILPEFSDQALTGIHHKPVIAPPGGMRSPDLIRASGCL